MTIDAPKNVPLAEGESVQTRRWANRTQSNLRAAGGRLYLTNQRVIFCPHAFDAALAGEYWWAQLADIVEVGKAKRDLRQLYGGGLRTRLKIVLRDGTTELFVVNKLNAVIEEIRAAAHP